MTNTKVTTIYWLFPGDTKPTRYTATNLTALRKILTALKKIGGKRVKSGGVRKNPSLFGAEAVAAAKQVTRSRTVKDKSSGERGRVIGAGPQGWLKIKWDSRDKPTLIRRSELKLARGRNGSLKNPIEIQRCTSCGQVFGQTTVCPMCHAGVGVRRNSDTRFIVQIVKASGGREQVTTNSAKEALMIAASWYSRGASITLIDRKAKTKDTYPPKSKWPQARNGITEAAAGLQALEYIGGRVKAGGKPKYKVNSRDALGVWHPNPQAFYHIEDANTKERYGSGNKRDMLSLLKVLRKEFPTVRFSLIASPNQKPLVQWRSMVKRKNPSVTALAEKFQGKADGSIEQMYAATGAPANLARAGKLVFLKVSGKTFRISGAMVAIAPNEKLWIVGKPPLFETKARNGEGLDVGEVTHICYETGKAHIEGGRVFEYVHEFGEEGGKRPHLIIDHEGMPILRGGDYKIRAEGIVN